MTSVLVTGATRGLGLATTAALRHRDATVLAAGRDTTAVDSVARRWGAEPVVLDLADLDSVRGTLSGLPPVDAVVCNAGVQVLRGLSTTRDGFEETFQVNHLAQLALVDALLSGPVPPRRIVFVGSATHDPAVRTGTPDPLEGDDLAALARARPDSGPSRAAGMRRYVTTKLLAASTAGALARERPDLHVTCFDPGVMPGTGLARQHPAVVRALWSTLLKGARVLPFASSPAASGRALAALLCDDPPPAPTGSYVDHRLRVRPASARARDTDYQDAVLLQSRRLLAGTLTA